MTNQVKRQSKIKVKRMNNVQIALALESIRVYTLQLRKEFSLRQKEGRN